MTGQVRGRTKHVEKGASKARKAETKAAAKAEKAAKVVEEADRAEAAIKKTACWAAKDSSLWFGCAGGTFEELRHSPLDDYGGKVAPGNFIFVHRDTGRCSGVHTRPTHVVFLPTRKTDGSPWRVPAMKVKVKVTASEHRICGGQINSELWTSMPAP